MTGTIMRLVRGRGFGFLKSKDGQEYFLHHSSMLGGEFAELIENDEVEFTGVLTPKGWRADVVRRLNPAPTGASNRLGAPQ